LGRVFGVVLRWGVGTCTTTATDLHLRADDAIAVDARTNRVGFVDTRGWFFARPRGSRTDYFCPLVINQTIAWVDRGHMSRTYGLQLARPFRAAFRRALFL
jgi:hypothetical protein